MKKIILTVALIASFMNVSKAQDKAFKKGDITAGLGIGLGIYGTRIHTTSSYQNLTFTHDTTDAAASVIYPLTLEYGITNWFGVGGRFAYSNYFTERDSLTGYKEKTTSLDADLMLNFHLVKSKRFDMPIVLTVGYSRFKINSNEPSQWMARDNGINFGFALNPRIYFGDHIGMFFNVGYAGYSYPSLRFSDKTDSNLNENGDYRSTFSLKGNGANIGFGLIGKF
ncbi:MAG TPA: outer membrane beta-barrel protein [Bacteroidia bacterium]|jgi:hypothetical protein